MDLAERANQILSDAESNLRSLVSEAATAGEYGMVVQIAGWARAVGDIAKSGSVYPGSKVHAATELQHGEQRPLPLKRTARRVGQDAYPQFFRKGTNLIRVAWSKRDKREYQHKASHGVLAALAAAVAEKGADGRVFSTDDILPLRDRDGNEIPSYQAYVGIALLKQTGLIDQHGRQGYSVPKLAEFEKSVETIWRNLVEQ